MTDTPDAPATPSQEQAALIDAAQAYARNYKGSDIPTDAELASSIANAFYAGWRYARRLAAPVQPPKHEDKSHLAAPSGNDESAQLDTQIPCDVAVGQVILREGAKLSTIPLLATSIASAPLDREIFVFNQMYGWYRTRGYERNGRKCWPLYGLFGADGGVWYPVPSHWMEVPLSPTGRPACSQQFGSAEFHDTRAASAPSGQSKPESSFYVVWCQTVGAPTVRHDDEGSATSEAERLARANPGAQYFVLQAIAMRQLDSMRRVQLDKQPF